MQRNKPQRFLFSGTFFSQATNLFSPGEEFPATSYNLKSSLNQEEAVQKKKKKSIAETTDPAKTE